MSIISWCLLKLCIVSCMKTKYYKKHKIPKRLSETHISAVINLQYMHKILLWYYSFWSCHISLCILKIHSPISFPVTSPALGQSYNCPSTSETILKNIGWIYLTVHNNWIYNHKHYSSVKFYRMYCMNKHNETEMMWHNLGWVNNLGWVMIVHMSWIIINL